jgi:hypothetical protein
VFAGGNGLTLRVVTVAQCLVRIEGVRRGDACAGSSPAVVEIFAYNLLHLSFPMHVFYPPSHRGVLELVSVKDHVSLS